ncbi:MAG TPA: methyltransferase, partial [Gammaproteobacteria bacterium]
MTVSDMTLPELSEFTPLLTGALTNNTLVRLLLTKPSGAEPELERIEVRPLVLRGVASLSFVYRYNTRDITKNHPVAEGVGLLDTLIGHAFRNIHLFLQDEEIQL